MKNIFILLISILIALTIHMTISIHILSQFVLFTNELISSSIFLVFLGLEVLAVYSMLVYLMRVKETNVWTLSKQELKNVRAIYILVTLIALYGRGLFTTRTSFSFDLSTFFAMDSNLALAAFCFNLLWFIPIGLWTNYSYKQCLLAFIILEFIQVVLQCGIFDLNDLILYSIGFAIGRLLKIKLIKS